MGKKNEKEKVKNKKNEEGQEKKVVEVEEKESLEETVNEKPKRSIMSVILIFVLFVGLVYIYARYVGTSGMRTKEYNIINENIPLSFDGFSIVQFSDLELGTTFNVEDVEGLVREINSLSPDLVVFTGDIVAPNHSITAEEQETLESELSKIDPAIGKYSVRGDDDQYTDVYNQVMARAGFKDISNSYELIYYKGLTPIVLYGLDSLNAGAQDYASTFSYPSPEEDTTYMATYRILLAHEPDTMEYVGEYNISLLLAGHSHNSEINIPYLRDYYNIRGAKSYYSEYYKVDGTELFVSSGLGTSKFKVRLFDKPSISIFRLYTD